MKFSNHLQCEFFTFNTAHCDSLRCIYASFIFFIHLSVNLPICLRDIHHLSACKSAFHAVLSGPPGSNRMLKPLHDRIILLATSHLLRTQRKENCIYSVSQTLEMKITLFVLSSWRQTMPVASFAVVWEFWLLWRGETGRPWQGGRVLSTGTKSSNWSRRNKSRGNGFRNSGWHAPSDSWLPHLLHDIFSKYSIVVIKG